MISYDELERRFKLQEEYLGTNKPVNNVEPLVTVSVITYQHAKFIKQCLDGILMQKTSFPIEIVIGEDGSKDATPDICKDYAERYPDKIRLFLRDREVSHYLTEDGQDFMLNGRFQKMHARGKYYAPCEGDDYWTDPLKLQKQVDFLEENREYSIIHSELGHYYIKSDKFIKEHWKTAGVTNQEGDIFNSLWLGTNSMIYACTAMFRADLVTKNKEWNELINQHIPSRDTSLFLHISRFGKVGYIQEPTAVRRVLLKSATQGQSFDYYIKFAEQGNLISDYFAQFTSLSKEVLQRKERMKFHRLLDLCFSFRKDAYDDFLRIYKEMPKQYRSFEFKMKRFGMEGYASYFIVKLILKARKRIGLKAI